MKGRAVYVFATTEDWLPGIRTFEQEHEVQYVRSGMFEEAVPLVFKSVTEIPDMGISRTGDSVSDSTYIIVPKGGVICSQEIPQRAGGVKYVVDHGTTPASVIWRPGGLFEERRAIIRGDISILPLHQTAVTLFKVFSRDATKGFLRKKGYRLGPAALDLYKIGYRLTTGVTAADSLDLGSEITRAGRL